MFDLDAPPVTREVTDAQYHHYAIYRSCIMDADIYDARRTPGSNFYPLLTASGGDEEYHWSVDYYPEQEPLVGNPCGWLFKVGYDEDGGDVIRQCSAQLTFTDRGYHCSSGHDYVTMETRYAEGWDYTDCPEEAAAMRKRGMGAVAMNGGAI